MADNKTEKFERECTIPLRRDWHKVPRYKRANRAVKAVKEFLVQHMKIRDRDLRKIKLDKYVNEEIWFRGIKNPPSKIKVKAIKEKDIVRVELFEMPKILGFKKAREEKSKEKSEKKKTEHIHTGETREHGETKGEEKSEEKKVEVSEKKAATVEGMEKLEKETAKKMKHQVSGKPNKATESRKGTLKSR